MQSLFRNQGALPNLASILLVGSIVATTFPPGYPAYIGSYATLVMLLVALLGNFWRERAIFYHPSSLAIVLSIVLVAATLPFVYRSEQDVLALVLILPMLSAIALGLLARPASWVPGPTVFALICLSASLAALLGGAYEHYVLGTYRPGLGNNPIHYSSLAAVAGCLAMVGIVANRSPWRYAFFLGPFFALGCAGISGSRGPLAGTLAMTGIGTLFLAAWLWRETPFRYALLVGLAVAAIGFAYLVGNGDARVASLLRSGLDIFRFTGGQDDIRAALYASALEVLATSPVVGVGLGQIMNTANALFPNLVPRFELENLHADWANFAAMAGGMGLLAWLLLLTAPLLLLLDARARRERPVVLGAILLTTGQFVLGISNATFGILPQTMIYAVSMGYFLVLVRRLGVSPDRVTASP